MLIKALVETRDGRQADALVDGIKTEFKTVDPGADNDTVKQAVNDSLRKGGQARRIIVDARRTGLTAEEALRAFNRISGIRRGKLDSVRIIGDEFDLTRNYT